MQNNLISTFHQTSWESLHRGRQFNNVDSFEILIYIQLCLELIICAKCTSAFCLIQEEASLINNL